MTYIFKNKRSSNTVDKKTHVVEEFTYEDGSVGKARNIGNLLRKSNADCPALVSLDVDEEVSVVCEPLITGVSYIF